MTAPIKMFDAHSDMLHDLYEKSLAGKTNWFNEFHAKQLSASIEGGSIWTMYSPDEFDLKEAVSRAFSLIDLRSIPDFKVILGFEGLRNLPRVEDMNYYYDLGFRHAMLTWNEENQYATGAGFDPQDGMLKVNHGLKDEGRRLLALMQDKGMIIDLAHLNKKSFFAAIDEIRPGYPYVIYSHGNCQALASHRRNMDDAMLEALKTKNGILGITLANNFVDDDDAHRTLSRLIDHVDHAVAILGIDNVGFGFDFMDYQSDFPNANIREVPDATKTSRIVTALVERGYSDADIAKLCWNNFVDRFDGLFWR